jgi:hypothetical protein
MLTLVISSTAYIPGVLAEEVPQSDSASAETVPEALDRAASQSSLLSKGNFFEDRSFLGDVGFTFGIGYDEDRIAKEARTIEAVSQDLLSQQTSDGPVIRTRDLANPYTTSVLTIQP